MHRICFIVTIRRLKLQSTEILIVFKMIVILVLIVITCISHQQVTSPSCNLSHQCVFLEFSCLIFRFTVISVLIIVFVIIFSLFRLNLLWVITKFLMILVSIIYVLEDAFTIKKSLERSIFLIKILIYLIVAKNISFSCCSCSFSTILKICCCFDIRVVVLLASCNLNNRFYLLFLRCL